MEWGVDVGMYVCKLEGRVAIYCHCALAVGLVR